MVTPKRTVLPQTETGLVLYMPFEEGTPGQAVKYATDYSIYGNHGTLYNFTFSGTSDWTTGVYGNALRFNGSNNFINIPDSPSLRPQSFTITLWYKPDVSDIGGTIIVKRGGDPGEESFWILHSGGDYKIYFRIYTDSLKGVSSSNPINEDRFYFIAFVHDASENLVKAYVDGKLVNSGTYTGSNTILYSDKPVRIGHRYGIEHVNGILDEIRIYNRVLSATEIMAHYKGANIKPF